MPSPALRKYREFLVREKLEDVAQHFVSQLLVLATGAEVQFADREARDRIVAKLAGNDYPVRSMIHEVAQSDLFRRQ